MKNIVMNYDEIIEYINRGYHPTQDLKGLMDFGYINKTKGKRYNIWVNEYRKVIDVGVIVKTRLVYTGASVSWDRSYIIPKCHLVYFPASHGYLVD